MNYPNNLNRNYKKNITYGNRGMDLENIINETNTYYKDNNIAIIYKKATPITALKTENGKITNGFYKEKSTLDYVGIYKGKYIEFDVKETKLNYLPLSNIKDHQINHIKDIIDHKGISFIIISIKENYYILNGKDFINYIDNYKVSTISYEYIKEYGIMLKYNYIKGLDYISKLNKIYKELDYNE